MDCFRYLSKRFDHRRKLARRWVVAFVSAVIAPWMVAAATAQTANVSENSPWVATWGAAMMATRSGHAPDFTGQTLRQIVHVSVGGEKARVWFSNRFGKQPLLIGASHIALRTNADALDATSDHTLTFNGNASVTIPPGATVVSDPIVIHIPPFANLAISSYFPNRTMGKTQHGLANQISYRASGNQTSATTLTDTAKPMESWYFLTGVDVSARAQSTVVTLGDSITDGARSTPDTNHRWPDDLAVRLAADADAKADGVLGVVNVGISGNRVLRDGTGPNAVSRFNRDVLARSGARDLIVLESINDIARYADHHQPYGDLEQRLELAFAEMAKQAHQHGIRIFGATLTPYQGCGCFTPEGEAVRDGLNHWIRTSSVLDGYVDFDQATRDPQHPLQYLPQYDSGDHVHPSDAGYQVMANAIDLSLFTKAVDLQAAGHGRP